eukprot:TRINITY_DN28379_c0_g1_i2.p1 TRINITY_DN28379_c0_g1~~TRINITY_DN28379_c0_g1_i2.p1  ORF type:complete len:142 (+),score=25.71 TRINITY_DN28379_c0_g1_i2:43-468(+)
MRTANVADLQTVMDREADRAREEDPPLEWLHERAVEEFESRIPQTWVVMHWVDIERLVDDGYHIDVFGGVTAAVDPDSGKGAEHLQSGTYNFCIEEEEDDVDWSSDMQLDRDDLDGDPLSLKELGQQLPSGSLRSREPIEG